MNKKPNLKSLFAALQADMVSKAQFSNVLNHPVDKGDNSEENWIKWFDDYVSQFYSPNEKEYPQFTGEMCYKLRCAFLHAGNAEGIPIDQFELCIDGCSCFGSTWSDENDKKHYIRINVVELCAGICGAAEQFYTLNSNQLDFSDTHITIINICKETEKIEKLNSCQ